MNISILSSSQRSNSETLRISKYIGGRIDAAGGTASVHDLHQLALSTDIEAVWQSGGPKAIVEQLEASDGAVFVTPEWHGMPSPALMNFLLHIGESLAHKPVLLVGVSGARGGAYPIAALRATGYKNTKYLMIPEHLIFRNVKELVQDGDPVSDDDKFMRRRTDYAVAQLLAYARNLGAVRSELPETPDDFGFGM